MPPILARAGLLAPFSSCRPVAVGAAGSHARPAEAGAGAPSGRPVIMIVVHGALAASTILLVALAAAGAG